MSPCSLSIKNFLTLSIVTEGICIISLVHPDLALFIMLTISELASFPCIGIFKILHSFNLFVQQRDI